MSCAQRGGLVPSLQENIEEVHSYYLCNVILSSIFNCIKHK